MSSSGKESYKLIYHAGIPGRAEPIRLYLEATHTPYEDTALTQGQDPVRTYTKDGFEHSDVNPVPFAVPVLAHGGLVISNVANIMLYLTSQVEPIDLGDEQLKASTPTKGRAPDYRLHGVMLTIMDLFAEAHDTHHPIAVGDYYKNQKEAARQRSKAFRESRVPRFFSCFELNLKKSGTGFIGKEISHVDLALFSVVDGLFYAFPKLMDKIKGDFHLLFNLHKRVKASSVISAYLQSERRQAYNENGIFRHLPELDEP